MTIKRLNMLREVRPTSDINDRVLVKVRCSTYSPFDDPCIVEYELMNGELLKFRIAMHIEDIRYFAFDVCNLQVDITLPGLPYLLWNKAIFVSAALER